MNKHVFAAAFLCGLIGLGWIGLGFIDSSPLAIAVTLVIAAFYVLGAVELRQYRQATASLNSALTAVPEPLPNLAAFLDRLPAALQNPVRLRIEGERGSLPGPALTPYLVGLLVMLGMLGTFLGMVMTLKGTVFALENTTELQAMRAALAVPVKGLGLAFGTSVAGVIASAMLGLMSAFSRRERIQASQLLDSRIATVLRPFTLAHQREESLRAVQAQSQAWPQLIDSMQSMMKQMDSMSQQLSQNLLGNQAQFHEQARLSYSELARSVEQSLRESLQASAQTATENIKPVVQSAIEGIAQEARLAHQRMAATAQEQFNHLNAGFADSAKLAAAGWSAAQQGQQQANADLLAQLSTTLQSYQNTLEQRSQALVQNLADSHAGLQHAQAQREHARMQAWTVSLRDTARELAEQWQRSSEQTLAQQQATAESLRASLQATADSLQSSLQATVDSVQSSLNTNAESMHSSLKATVDSMQTGFKATVDTVQAGMQSTADSVQIGLQATVASVQTTLQSKVESMQTSVKANADSVQAGLQATADSVQAGLQGIASNLQSGLQATVESIQAGLQTTVESVQTALTTTSDNMSTSVKASADSMQASVQVIAAEALKGQSETLHNTQALLSQAEELMRQRIAAEAQWMNQQRESSEQLATLLRSELSALRDAEATRGEAAVQRLGDLQTALASHLATLGTALEAPITRLIEVASEAPRSAAEVIAQLRQEISRSVARDNEVLEERSRILATLKGLLDGIEHASRQQREVIESLVSQATNTLQASSNVFAQQLSAESNRLSETAAQVSASTVEISSLGEALGVAVQSFSQANEKLVDNLQRIEAAMEKSQSRSDEQLAYYLAQAREIIDLSMSSQKAFVEELRRVPALPAAEEAR